MTDPGGAVSRRYNRELLLSRHNRSTILALEEVVGYGSDSFDDPDYVSVYGLKPADLPGARACRQNAAATDAASPLTAPGPTRCPAYRCALDQGEPAATPTGAAEWAAVHLCRGVRRREE